MILEAVFFDKKDNYLSKMKKLIGLHPLLKLKDFIIDENITFRQKLKIMENFVLKIAFFKNNERVEKIIKRRTKKLLLYDAQSIYNEIKSGMEAMTKLSDNINPFKIRVPTLLIWGRNDLLVPYRTGSLAKFKIGFNSKLKKINFCGHYPQVEKPQEFNEAVLEFIKN